MAPFPPPITHYAVAGVRFIMFEGMDVLSFAMNRAFWRSGPSGIVKEQGAQNEPCGPFCCDTV